jgi:hypothetical protein
VEGAVLCLVLDIRDFVPGRDFEAERNENVIRFHHGLPPDVVEYVLVHEEIRFTGPTRARLSPYPEARFKKRTGKWVPVQKSPVRYSRSAVYSDPQEFLRVCTERLLEELGELTALEIFSAVFAAVDPWDVVTHRDILDTIERRCVPNRQVGKWRTLRAREP